MRLDPDPLIASGERESSRGAEPVGALLGGQYRVLGLLGSGGMAEVYEVEHVGLGRHFALKLLRSELARDTSLVERFEREARAVAKLESAHIVAIVDSGAFQGAPYFVMERLYGEELRRLLTRSGALPIQRAVHIALDVCRALTVAHAAGVVHRDLKPENLFITRSELGTDHCKVLDFGVAKLAGENPTMPGTLMGTARYMAPEQISHSTSIAPFTDIFSLGVILYECLSGQAPFAADTLERVLFRILNEEPPALLELRPEIPPSLSELVQRALAKAGSDRPQSAAAFAEALSQFILERRAGSSPSFQGDVTLIEVDRMITDKVAAPTAFELQPTLVDAKRGNRRARLLVASVTFAAGLALGVTWGRSSGRGQHLADEPSPTETPTAAVTQERLLLPETGETTGSPAASAVETKRPLGQPTETRPPPKASASAASGAPAPSAPPLFFPQDSGAPKH